MNLNDDKIYEIGTRDAGEILSEKYNLNRHSIIVGLDNIEGNKKATRSEIQAICKKLARRQKKCEIYQNRLDKIALKKEQKEKALKDISKESREF